LWPYLRYYPNICREGSREYCEKPQSIWAVSEGRAIAQAVSRRLPTAAARVRAQARSCGICGGQSGTRASFLRVLLFPLPILIPPTTPHSSYIIRGWYYSPISGRRIKWTQSHLTLRKKKQAISGQRIEPGIFQLRSKSPIQSTENVDGC
jgi:hypothetical protein